MPAYFLTALTVNFLDRHVSGPRGWVLIVTAGCLVFVVMYKILQMLAGRRGSRNPLAS